MRTKFDKGFAAEHPYPAEESLQVKVGWILAWAAALGGKGIEINPSPNFDQDLLTKFKKFQRQGHPEKMVQHFENIYTAAVVLYEKALCNPSDDMAVEIIKHFELGEYAAVVATEVFWR